MSLFEQVDLLISHLESQANRKQKRMGAFKSLQTDLTYLIREEERDLDETLDVIVEAEATHSPVEGSDPGPRGTVELSPPNNRQVFSFRR